MYGKDSGYKSRDGKSPRGLETGGPRDGMSDDGEDNTTSLEPRGLWASVALASATVR